MYSSKLLPLSFLFHFVPDALRHYVLSAYQHVLKSVFMERHGCLMWLFHKKMVLYYMYMMLWLLYLVKKIHVRALFIGMNGG